MRELLRFEADVSMELHFKPLTTFRLDPLTVYALVLLFRPGILKLMQFKALAFKAFDLCPYTLSIVSLTVLKGIPKHVRYIRDGFLWREIKLLNLVTNLLFDAVTAFPAVTEADQMAVWILAFHGTHRWR